MAVVGAVASSPPAARAEPFEPEAPLDPCFLTPDKIDAYIEYARTGTAADPSPFRILNGPIDWSQESSAFPLVLCEFLAHKSTLAYKSKDVIRAHLSRDNVHGIDVESFEFFDSKGIRGDTQGYGFVLGDTAFIVMRGTSSLMDWIDDFSARMTSSSSLRKKTLDLIGDPSPPRHLGFARAWANVSDQIEKWVKTLPEKGFKVRQYCFSGHSLGGALAILGAHDFARRKGYEVAAVVTFAAPKVGGSEFAADYNDEALKLRGRTLRLESVEDAVPRLALSSDFTPVGIQWLITKRPMIAGWEVFTAALLGLAGWSSGKSESKPEAPQEAKPAPSSDAPTTQTPPDKGSDDKAAPTAKEAEVSKDTTPSDPADARRVIFVIIGIVGAIVIFLAARKLIIRYRAHGVGKRYALYLSTLSYRTIRTLRGEDYERASADFDCHLARIRGKDSSVYRSLRKRPVRITAKNIASYRDAKGYENYIW